MPKPKHRRKADGKTVPHPGRKRGGAALVIIEEAKREVDGLPPQKDVTGLPRPHLFFTAIWQSHHWRRRGDSISASSDGLITTSW